jgi:hypothetical protein
LRALAFRKEKAALDRLGFTMSGEDLAAGWTIVQLAEPEGFEPSIGLYKPITV